MPDKELMETIVKQAVRYLASDPEGNLESIFNLFSALASQEDHKAMAARMREYLADKDSNWRRLLVDGIKETAPRVRERLIMNLITNSWLVGIPKRLELAENIGINIPWAILIDPTDRCNLRCRGCWAGEYAQKNDLDLSLLDRVISEGEALNIFFYVISGGEPLIRKNDLAELARRHPGSIFHIFTNGTLIDNGFARECAAAGNVVFAISIDGFEESTDSRRGRGTFQKVMRAAEVLKKHGLVYGFSATYHRHNVEEVTSDEFIDMLVDRGFRFGWLFTYIPVGADSDLDFMAAPQQRAYAFRRIRELRKSKPILLADFWNDGELTDGCIAGGRKYFHINAAGDVEPCAFIHYSTCNIKDVSLKEALGNPLFKAYQKRQPFNSNFLRPCPLIDNPTCLAECVSESGARSTQKVPVNADEMAASLDGYAKEWGAIADRLTCIIR